MINRKAINVPVEVINEMRELLPLHRARKMEAVRKLHTLYNQHLADSKKEIPTCEGCRRNVERNLERLFATEWK